MFLYFIAIAFSLFAAAPEPGSLKATVIIPCAAQHFVHLPPLLGTLAEQTRAPFEVVISLSEVERLNPSDIDHLEGQLWPFRLNILRHMGKRSAGMNRNLACKVALGDLVICQDADDIPHPERVEIICFLFEKYPITHLLHTYILDRNERTFSPYCIEEITPSFFRKYDDLEPVYQDRLHNGNVSFLREVARRIHWDDVFECDHDVKFNRDVYRSFSGCAAISCDLILYRQKLSAFNPANIPWSQ